jgi:hypothetical protein
MLGGWVVVLVGGKVLFARRLVVSVIVLDFLGWELVEAFLALWLAY